MFGSIFIASDVTFNNYSFFHVSNTKSEATNLQIQIFRLNENSDFGVTDENENTLRRSQYLNIARLCDGNKNNSLKKAQKVNFI